MQLNDYQQKALTTAVFKNPEDKLTVCLLGLAGESGEIFEKVKKNLTHTTENGLPKYSNEDIAKEIGDVIWYIAVLSDVLGYSLEDIAKMNIDKLNKRNEKGVIVAGEGDNR